jgi:glycosyltransferase involved in cell wall biosynthesis
MNYSQFAPVIRQANPAAKICLHMECEWLTQLDRRVIEERLAAIDVVIGCSEYITGTIADRYPRFAHRCVTVPNAATLVAEYDRALTEPGHVLFVGRVSPEKGVHVLVEAFHKVLQQVPTATLHVAGGIGSAPYEYLVGLSDDPRVADLARFYKAPAAPGKDPYGEWLMRAAGEELGKRIVFEGRVDHSAVQTYYKRAAVLVNPSLSEAFGMSLVEAMMYRVPVVASRVGGMTNIVNHGETGFLVDADDADALASGICQVLADRRRADDMGDAGRARALEKYSWDKTTDLLIDYFRMALEGRPLH